MVQFSVEFLLKNKKIFCEGESFDKKKGDGIDTDISASNQLNFSWMMWYDLSETRWKNKFDIFYVSFEKKGKRHVSHFFSAFNELCAVEIGNSKGKQIWYYCTDRARVSGRLGRIPGKKSSEEKSQCWQATLWECLLEFRGRSFITW